MPYAQTYNVDTLEQRSSHERYGRVLVELGTAHPEIVVLTADLSRSTRATDFFHAFPARAFNLGIAEQNLVGTAAGLAASGYLPYVVNIATFQSMRSFEQIRTDFGYPRLKGVFLSIWPGMSGGFVGATHHALEDLALMRVIPGMAVVAPANADDTAAATRAAYDHPGPVYVRVASGKDESGAPVAEPFVLGQAVVTREGTDATVIACGPQIAAANTAADRLAAVGRSVRVVYCHTLKPLDGDTVLQAARDTRTLVTVEDHSIIGGLGSAVAEVLAGAGSGARLIRLGVPDTFTPIGTARELYAHFGIDADGIERTLRAAIL